jgi:hypothetical protein
VNGESWIVSRESQVMKNSGTLRRPYGTP